METLRHLLLLTVMVALSCFNFAYAQQMPVEFLDIAASNKPQLTPEQAAQVAGFYNLTKMVRSKVML